MSIVLVMDSHYHLQICQIQMNHRSLLSFFSCGIYSELVFCYSDSTVREDQFSVSSMCSQETYLGNDILSIYKLQILCFYKHLLEVACLSVVFSLSLTRWLLLIVITQKDHMQLNQDFSRWQQHSSPQILWFLPSSLNFIIFLFDFFYLIYNFNK